MVILTTKIRANKSSEAKKINNGPCDGKSKYENEYNCGVLKEDCRVVGRKNDCFFIRNSIIINRVGAIIADDNLNFWLGVIAAKYENITNIPPI